MSDILKAIEETSMMHQGNLSLKRFSKKQIEEFHIGFLPKHVFPWGEYDQEVLLQLGLFYSNKGRGYSPFENRIIIPIYDRDKLVGIVGRSIDNDGGSKYINTVFKKHQHFYTKPGQSFKQARGIVLVEGYTDVISFYEALMFNPHLDGYLPAGLMGVSLGDSRIDRLNKFGRPVIFGLDCDKAGNEGLYRLHDDVIKLWVPVSVLYSSDGFDPDDRVNKGIPFPSEITLGAFIAEHLREKPAKERVRFCVQHGYEEYLTT